MDKNENVRTNENLETRELGVEGMTCEHCASRVEKALRGVEGVKEVHVDLAGAKAKVTFDRSRASVPMLQDAVVKSGYRPK